MPVYLRLGAEDLVRCRFTVSPLCETHEAVRTVTRRERHGYHLPWLRRMRAAVAALDLAPIQLLMPLRGGYTPDFLGPPPEAPFNASWGFEEELARVRATSTAIAREELARSLACTPGAAESPAGRAMLADPAAAVQQLADLTERVWHALIEPDWPALRAVLEADIGYRTRRLAQGGLEEMFTDLHPGLSWADRTLTIRNRGDFLLRQDVGGRGVLLMPSVFAWPDVISGFAPPWQPTVVYPARGMAGLWQQPAPGAPDTLIRLLGPNRAALLGGLDEPASTTALARRHGLALSSVSAHLRTLRDAGLLTARRHGHQVLYARTPLGLALLGQA
ncbi:DUF5937 family protein [Streptomyces sp. N2-109]|uniref:DUF5937 family protein n=1 Tax=Streptomyces gossypii TaxID=2883101 RepID=A0ABT2K2Z6_9ACTN|nr:DUF5937 family protein [Streptomyces gossypii]MCT2594466.1 DUF5937 family protein [Streptomyces gossypii]